MAKGNGKLYMSGYLETHFGSKSAQYYFHTDSN